MLPKISDEQVKILILKARRTGNLECLLPELPIWMADKTAKKRKLSEDDRSEMILTILEKWNEMWNLSLKYHSSIVLGFFVTYGFNTYRNAYRKNQKLEIKNEYIELWQERKENEDSYSLLAIKEKGDVLTCLESLPLMSGLVLILRFDLPILGHHRKTMEWRLHEIGRKFVDFERIYDKKKESQLKKLDLYSTRVVRYTRLLLDCPENEKRRWYIKKKKQWVLLREKALNRCFFSEREVSQLLGLSRKETRSHIAKGTRLLYMRRKELLHCA
jgi:hypothetical protein